MKVPENRKAKTFPAVFYRSYSRVTPEGKRESYPQVVERVVDGLKEIGKFTEYETKLLKEKMMGLTATSSGRSLWYAGTESSKNPDNFPGLYNCVSIDVKNWEDFCRLFYLQLLGCGVGAVLEPRNLNSLSKIENYIDLKFVGEIGDKPKSERQDMTTVECNPPYSINIVVGDSKEGWVELFRQLLNLSTDCHYHCQNGFGGDHCGNVKVSVDISHIRPIGEKLKGFGGTANPSLFKSCFEKVVKILNKAVGRKLSQLEATLLIDEPALLVVSGGIRRSAGMRQYSSNAPLLKLDLWSQSEDSMWRIDPEKSSLRMANHTQVYHHKPLYNEIEQSIRMQHMSGEGAIQYAPEVLARANADLLSSPELKQDFINSYERGNGKHFLLKIRPQMSEKELNHRLHRYGLNPCGQSLDFAASGSNIRC